MAGNATGKLAGKRILIVDDDPDIILQITSALSDSGAALDTANDGNTAVDLAEKKDPDMVILDIMLPRRSGFGRFGSRRGNSLAVPARRAAQGPAHGQMPQAGLRGVQTVAPRSMTACA